MPGTEPRTGARQHLARQQPPIGVLMGECKALCGGVIMALEKCRCMYYFTVESLK